jgi:Domain of unknown function (DUF4292)
MKSYFFLISLTLTLLASSCKRQALTTTPPKADSTAQVVQPEPQGQKADTTQSAKLPPRPYRTVNDGVPATDSPKNEQNEDPKIDEIDFKYLKAKSKVDFKSPKLSQKVNVNIRIRKDSVIWISVSHPLAGEVMRGVFTKDSVKLVDYFNKSFYLFDYQGLAEQMDIDLNFGMIQSLIVGNRPLKKKGKTRREPNFFIVTQNEGKVQLDNYIGEDKKLKKILVKTDSTSVQRKLEMSFEDFNSLNNYIFPYTSVIMLESEDAQKQSRRTVVRLNHTKVELLDEALEFPFRVPSNFKK